MRRCRNSVSLSAIVLVLLCDESTHVVDILREEKGERGCEGRWRCPLCCTEAIQAPRLLLGKYPKYSRPLPRGRIQDGKRIIKCNELWLCSRYFCRSCALCVSPRSTSSRRQTNPRFLRFTYPLEALAQTLLDTLPTLRHLVCDVERKIMRDL
jgi:hypothetical protein